MHFIVFLLSVLCAGSNAKISS